MRRVTASVSLRPRSGHLAARMCSCLHLLSRGMRALLFSSWHGGRRCHVLAVSQGQPRSAKRSRWRHLLAVRAVPWWPLIRLAARLAHRPALPPARTQRRQRPPAPVTTEHPALDGVAAGRIGGSALGTSCPCLDGHALAARGIIPCGTRAARDLRAQDSPPATIVPGR
jgi:hypothetical protein